MSIEYHRIEMFDYQIPQSRTIKTDEWDNFSFEVALINVKLKQLKISRKSVIWRQWGTRKCSKCVKYNTYDRSCRLPSQI